MEADLAALHAAPRAPTARRAPTRSRPTSRRSCAGRKILSDNGAPLNDLHMMIDTTAGAKMRTLGQLTKANEAADVMLRQGVLLDIHGFDIRESARSSVYGRHGRRRHDRTTAGYAVGATTSRSASAGTGTIVAGDVITFAGDTNKYVVAGDTDVSNGGTFVIAAPGL
jgi:hypothetical protein